MDNKTKMDLLKMLNENYEKTRDLVNSIQDEVRSFKNGVYDRMDKVYGELLNIRTEQSAHSQQHDDLNDRLDKLESPSSYAHRINKSK